MRTTRLAAAAVVIGGGVAPHVVSSSAQTATDVKGPETQRGVRSLRESCSLPLIPHRSAGKKGGQSVFHPFGSY